MPDPLRLDRLVSRPNPAEGYDDAVRRVAARQAQEASGYNPRCRTQLLTHGHQAARAIAFVHGYTNCPDQFARLGQQFYEIGYNVLLAPAPRHGLADAMTRALSGLTAEEMAAYADELVDIGRGLGQHVTLAGFSLGGVIAGWAAQTRPDLDQAVLIAPSFGLARIPERPMMLATRAVLKLPELYLWWAGVVRLDPRPPPPAPVQGYPRFSTHGLAQGLRLGFATRARARRTAPGARRIVLVTNGADLAVNNAAAEELAAEWRAGGVSQVVTYQFPARLRLDHDLVDPHVEDQKVDIVYPKLIELIGFGYP